MPQRITILQKLRLVIFGISLEAALQDPRWQVPARDLDVAEIFTTAQSVVLAGGAAGYRAEGYDLGLPGCASATTEAGFHQILRLVMRLRVGGLLCVAPCCKSFVFAPRRWTCRSAANVVGDTSRPMVRDGNLMANIAMFIYSLAILRGAEALLENPSGSMIFRSGPLRVFCATFWRWFENAYHSKEPFVEDTFQKGPRHYCFNLHLNIHIPSS